MQPLTLVATVSTGNSATTATGTVTYTANGTQIGTASLGAQGCASQSACLNTTLSGGVQNVVATYSGDTTYSSSSGTLNLTVSRIAATLTITPPSPVAVFGQPVTLTAQIQPSAQSTGTPAGTVQVLDNGAAFGTAAAVSNGKAVLSLAGLAPGAHSIAVQYSGDGNFSSASGTAGAFAVVQGQTATTITSSPKAGQMTLTAQVTAVAPSAGTPAGSIKFVDATTGAALANAPLVGGTATASAASATDSIAALYSGDVNFLPSASPAAGSAALVNAASYGSTFAPGEIVSVFATAIGAQLQTASAPLPSSISGVSVIVTDSANIPRLAGLFYVSPTQLAFLLPAQTAVGSATVIVNSNLGSLAASIAVSPSAAALFTANASGEGPLAAQTVSAATDGTSIYASTAALNGATFANVPITLSSNSDTYLLLYGTGFDKAASVAATINGQTITPAYFGPQGGFAGLDQVNVLLPPILSGSGQVNVSITVDGHTSNAGTILIQ
jgi:uncharacterized protein (TIGR03437 family)